jgi:integrase
MNVIDHDDTDGKKVWLSIDETDQLLNEPDSMERSIAFELAVRCGLRSAEVLEVTPDDVVETDAGDMLKVPDGKGDKYRETPLPSTLKRQIQTVAEMRDEGSDEPIISVTTTQSLRNWINSSREALAEETDDDRWNHLSMHDLRRTWATQVAENDVDPLVVCQWGGWNDLDTFLEHYRGTYSPEAQRRERDKVNWL